MKNTFDTLQNDTNNILAINSLKNGDCVAVVATNQGRCSTPLTPDICIGINPIPSVTAHTASAVSMCINDSLQINASVDPSLLGGLVVKVGSRMIDSSLRTKLSTLKLRMKEVG